MISSAVRPRSEATSTSSGASSKPGVTARFWNSAARGAASVVMRSARPAPSAAARLGTRRSRPAAGSRICTLRTRLVSTTRLACSGSRSEAGA